MRFVKFEITIMNKIVLNFGLLVFCFSLIFFSQRQMPLMDVIIKSIVVFVVFMIFLSLLTLIMLKLLSKTSEIKLAKTKETLEGKK